MHHPARGELVAEQARRIAVFLPEMHRDEIDPDCRRVALDVDVMAGEKVLGHPEPRHALGVTRGDAFRANQDRAVRAPDLGALGEELREERRLKPALVEQSEVAVDGPYDFVMFHPVECVRHDGSPWARDGVPKTATCCGIRCPCAAEWRGCRQTSGARCSS